VCHVQQSGAPEDAFHEGPILHVPRRGGVNCRFVKLEGSRARSGRETVDLRNLPIRAAPNSCTPRCTTPPRPPRVAAYRQQAYHPASFQNIVILGFTELWVLGTGGGGWNAHTASTRRVFDTAHVSRMVTLAVCQQHACPGLRAHESFFIHFKHNVAWVVLDRLARARWFCSRMYVRPTNDRLGHCRSNYSAHARARLGRSFVNKQKRLT
jgi:hypothetical protein